MTELIIMYVHVECMLSYVTSLIFISKFKKRWAMFTECKRTYKKHVRIKKTIHARYMSLSVVSSISVQMLYNSKTVWRRLYHNNLLLMFSYWHSIYGMSSSWHLEARAPSLIFRTTSIIVYEFINKTMILCRVIHINYKQGLFLANFN